MTQLEELNPRATPRPPRAGLGNLRILHVFDHSLPLHSGYSFRSASLLHEQRLRGWHTIQLTTPKHTAPGPTIELVEGITFHRTPSLSPAIGAIPVLRELALVKDVAHQIENIAKAEQPHLLHAHSPVLNALACLMATRRLRLPIVYEVRGFWEDAAVSHGTAREGGPRYRLTRALETYALRRCDAVAPICEGLRNDMVQRGIPPERITIIPNGVDIKEFPFGSPPDVELIRSLRLEGRLVLGFLGSYYAYEGLGLLLTALPAIREKLPNVTLLLVGGGPEEQSLKDEARKLGLEDVVRFIGRVPHTVVQNYYGLVDIFTYPRLPMRLTETVTPLKPLEAMARGGIVLASDVGGHRELIRDGDTGYLFQAGNQEALASAVLRLVAERASWPSMRLRARQFVERERTWHASATGYDKLYAYALEHFTRG